MANCVTNLTCIHCGATFPGANLKTAEATWMVCPRCGPMDGILDIGYDLDRVQAAWQKRPLQNRPRNQWRYEELLPLEPDSIHRDWSDGYTPIVETPRLAQQLGVRQIVLKDEGRNPTGSFKDRSSAVGVTHALQVGAKTISCASTGNAASSLAGHAALAGLPAYIFVPQTAPEPKVAQLLRRCTRLGRGQRRRRLHNRRYLEGLETDARARGHRPFTPANGRAGC